MMVVSCILVVLAGLSNAMMDTLAHHWYKFRWKEVVDPQFWDPSKSWRNKYIGGEKAFGRKMLKIGSWTTPFKYPVQITDAWHLFKTIMLLCWILALISFDPGGWWRILYLAIYGCLWIGSFNLGYNILFVKKKT